MRLQEWFLLEMISGWVFYRNTPYVCRWVMACVFALSLTLVLTPAVLTCLLWHIFWHIYWHFLWHVRGNYYEISTNTCSVILTDTFSNMSTRHVVYWHLLWHVYSHLFGSDMFSDTHSDKSTDTYLFCHFYWHLIIAGVTIILGLRLRSTWWDKHHYSRCNCST